MNPVAGIFLFQILLFQTALVYGRCNFDEWKCKNGDCILAELLCDGVYHCNDKSDESKDTCLDSYCPRYAYRCSYGACIRKTAQCNGKKDCVDDSDEISCTPDEIPHTKCSDNEENNFQCDSGHCISDDKVCDGKADCADKSDETLRRCLKNKCPGYSFRCAYGACVSKKARCNGVNDCNDGSDEIGCGGPTVITADSKPGDPTKGCTLPASNGLFAEDTETNEIVRSGGLLKNGGTYNYKCPENHILIGAQVDVCNGGQLISAQNQNLPRCSRYCKPQILFRITTQAICKYKRNVINCNDFILPETTADIQCRTGYQEPDAQEYSITCQSDGEWDKRPFPCVPICGDTPAAQKQFIHGGYEATITNIPWQAAIYRRNDAGRYEHICGGSIITAKLVVTAAHCLWDRQQRKGLPKSLFTVGVGKTLRDYYTDDPDYSPQFSNISDYVISDYFFADSLSYLSDFAVVVLNNAIIFETFIKPICFERQPTVNKDIESNIIGKIAGWGTDENGKPSAYLKFINLASISKADCQKKVDVNYESYVQGDKFCVGHDELNSTLCDGDSGGGFAVKKKSKFYLNGVVSTGLKRPKDPCGTNFYTTFTNIQYHTELIGDLEKKYRVY